MALLFDDSEKLKEAVGKEAAEVIAHVLERQDEQYKKELATKADIARVETKIENLELSLDNRIKVEIHSAKADIIKWIAGLMIVQAASIAALVKLVS
ncbi:hypothetical protein D0S45_15280 [Marinifilum sp. JC120]|nr:hypothetical protein D0S45_15280 [Marinifilum sp. JC120]